MSAGVYVRVRPLLESELKKKVAFSPRLGEDSSLTSNNDAVAMQTPDGKGIGGFAGVFGPKEKNASVFANSFKSSLGTVLAGGCSTFLSYGYTGSGKTHTVLGYGGETGMYGHAAEYLLSKLALTKDSNMYLNASALELYHNQVYDLLGDKKVKCSVRMDRSGQLQVQGSSESIELQTLVPDIKIAKGYHATLVTRLNEVRAAPVRCPEDLKAVTESSVKLRSVGTSTEHEQSSRSHAILKLEVTTPEVIAAKQKLYFLSSMIPALKNARSNEIHSKDWKQAEAAGGEEKRIAAAERTKRVQALEAELTRIQVEEVAAQDELNDILAKVHPAVGGCLILVDLAGADYDHRDASQARKESLAINTSLLALKECLRSIAKVPGAPTRPPFRQANLTRVLQDSLLPQETSKRRNRTSISTILINISPAQHLERMTSNALRYGQLFAGAKKLGKSSVMSNSSKVVFDVVIERKLRQIYKQNCPDKSEEEVNAILAKAMPRYSNGKENILLNKVRLKYQDSSQKL